MTPSGLTGVIAFLIFVAPGAAFELVYQRGQPLLRSTTFREINRVTLMSIAAWIVVAVPAALLPNHADSWLARSISALDAPGLKAEPAKAIPVLLLAVLATSFAAGVAKFINRGRRTFKSATLWNEALNMGRKKGEPQREVFLWAIMADGTHWGGYYRGADLRDIPMNDREVLLGFPISFKGPDAEEVVEYKDASTIWLRASAIDSMTLSFGEVDSDDG